MTLRLLSYQDAVELPEIPQPDVYFTLAYGHAEEQRGMGQWMVAIWEPGPIVLPFMKTSIDPEMTDGVDLFDIASPYGYCGAWAPSDLPTAELLAFREALVTRLRDEGVVSEFLRFSPLLENHNLLRTVDEEIDFRLHNHTVAVDLVQGAEDYWAAVKPSARSKVRKADRLGYQCEIVPIAPDHLASGSDFRTLYESRMQSVSAGSAYFFPDAYYEQLATGLEGNLFLARVSSDEGVGAACLLMTWEGVVHYHLSASSPTASKDGANNLMLDASIRWSMESGHRTMHLGGGLRDGDSLFQFKKNFGRSHLEFWIGRRIIDQAKYKELSRSRPTREGEDFFPIYKAPVAE